MLIAIQISMRGSFIAFGHWAARETEWRRSPRRDLHAALTEQVGTNA